MIRYHNDKKEKYQSHEAHYDFVFDNQTVTFSGYGSDKQTALKELVILVRGVKTQMDMDVNDFEELIKTETGL